MNTRRFFAAVAVGLLVGLQPVSSQNALQPSIEQAEAHYNNFVRYYSNGNEEAAYLSLYQSYEAYRLLVGNSALSSRVRAGLRDIYPYLQNAAYFFSGQNNQQRTLQFAQAHIGLSMMPEMQGENLPKNANYTILAKLAAFNTWNRREYVQAIPYLQAYLNTGDKERREDAYACLGKAYYTQKDYTKASYILAEGLRQYPQNLSMLSTMINTCMDGGDDSSLQRYLTQALALKPSDEGLLNTQGLLYEKQQKFEQAIPFYLKIKQNKPQSLEVARHLALDYYNAGVQYLSQAKENKTMAQQYMQKSESCFRKAVPILNDILAADPLSVKYACALATAYSCLGETSQKDAMNSKITALGFTPIQDNAMPDLIALNDPTPVPAPTPKPVQPAQPAQQSAQPVQQPAQPATPQNDVAKVVSDVDINIPVCNHKNENTFAVIIANEKYTKVSEVPLANNDGKVFAEYCQKVLGMPADNVRTHYDATYGEMVDALDEVKNIADACQGQLNIIFYYAGHGIPDESTKDAYLLPVDARGNSTISCMSLEKVYEDLKACNAQSVTVFLDACFSGAMRGGDMLASARGVAIKPKPQDALANMVVFAATADDQTALPYQEKQHGMFTYYLLKKLKESRGNVTLKELGDYLTKNVSLQSVLKNHKKQTPTVKTGTAFAGKWEQMKLIDQ